MGRPADTARTLLFACRRLGLDRVLVILTGWLGVAQQAGEGWTRFITSDRRSSVLTLTAAGNLCGEPVSSADCLCSVPGK